MTRAAVILLAVSLLTGCRERAGSPPPRPESRPKPPTTQPAARPPELSAADLVERAKSLKGREKPEQVLALLGEPTLRVEPMSSAPDHSGRTDGFVYERDRDSFGSSGWDLTVEFITDRDHHGDVGTVYYGKYNVTPTYLVDLFGQSRPTPPAQPPHRNPRQPRPRPPVAANQFD